ncbi:MAG: serine/threonine-protein kinase [Gemmatimonadota bacterium]|nr:serine/threonine-protein kinase [Gemmatimonadota bacterium]
MTEEVEHLCARALELPANERDAFVLEACGDRRELGDEILSLLAHADAGEQFFDDLAVAMRAALPAIDAEVASLDPMIGRIVGRFRITALLGRGGMGAVYRARDERLDRDVALKLLPPHIADDPDAVGRFLVEARAAGTLSHPNVCTVHEIGESDDGRTYIAMTMYEGETLRQRLARGPLPAREAAAIARDLARALRAAHARGIIHRDVKPANVMLGCDGTTRLLDFGLARLGDATLSAAGATPGTIAYMSPEQFCGAPVDHRTDLWSLGVVLHEMLAGVRPFHGGSDRAVQLAIQHDPPATFAEVQSPVPPSLQRVVERLLRKAPEERLGDAAAVEAELDSVLSGNAEVRSAVAPTRGLPAARGRRRMLLPLVALGCAVALAVAIPGAIRQHGPDESKRVAATSPARSLAVLPFVDMSGDTANRYFSDGLTEEITTTLGHIRGLQVAARSSSFALRGRDLDVRTIGDTLGVDAVLEGSVRRADRRLRVAARLIDARTGLQLWSDEYEREMSDVLTMQDEIARAIAEALELRMPAAGGMPRSRGATDPAAYDLYLHALSLRSQFRPEALRRASGLLDRAVEIQPDFALAWAAKTSVIAPLVFFRQVRADRGVPEMRAATDRAFALDPLSGEAHVARGIIQLFWDWNWTDAWRSLDSAVVLTPSDPHAWQQLANYWRAVASPDEAAAARLRGLALDPLDPRLRYALGDEYLAAGRLAEARAAYERAAALDPMHPSTLGLGPTPPRGTWSVSLAEGREADAVQELLRVATLRGASADEADALRRAFASGGIRGFWLRWIVMDERLSKPSVDPMRLASLRAMAGDTARALDVLEKAYAARNPALVFIRTSPEFAALRDQRRYRRIVEAMRFPPR